MKNKNKKKKEQERDIFFVRKDPYLMKVRDQLGLPPASNIDEIIEAIFADEERMWKKSQKTTDSGIFEMTARGPVNVLRKKKA